MLLRATTGNDCVQFRFEGGQSARKIDKSVGQGGFNVKADVLKIQRLLNLIAPTEGGPPPATPEGLGLKEDGIAGPKTIGAIKAFQLRQGTGSDGRVDPGGPTLKRMNEVPKNALALRNKGRLLKVAKVFSDLVSIAEKARLGPIKPSTFCGSARQGWEPASGRSTSRICTLRSGINRAARRWPSCHSSARRSSPPMQGPAPAKGQSAERRGSARAWPGLVVQFAHILGYRPLSPPAHPPLPRGQSPRRGGQRRPSVQPRKKD